MEAGNRETRARRRLPCTSACKDHSLKRLLFRFVLHNARRAIANRENMRFDRSRVYGLVRRMFQRLGKLFAQKGVLEQASDIFYLTVAEVFGWVEGAALTVDLKSLVALRKAEYARFAELHLKNRLLTTGLPYLSPLEELEKGLPTREHPRRGPAALPGSPKGWPGLSFRPRRRPPGATTSSWPRPLTRVGSSS